MNKLNLIDQAKALVKRKKVLGKLIRKFQPKDLPKGSMENGCIIIDNSVTEEDLKKLQNRD